MKEFLLLLALVCAPLLVATSAHADNLDFTLVNKTGYVINEVYVSSVSTKDWEEDVMGRDILERNDSVHIQFEKGSKGCYWDMLVIYDDGEEVICDNLNLCTTSRVLLKYNRKTGETWADLE